MPKYIRMKPSVALLCRGCVAQAPDLPNPNPVVPAFDRDESGVLYQTLTQEPTPEQAERHALCARLRRRTSEAGCARYGIYVENTPEGKARFVEAVLKAHTTS